LIGPILFFAACLGIPKALEKEEDDEWTAWQCFTIYKAFFTIPYGTFQYISNITFAYFLRPDNPCPYDDRLPQGGWQFQVQTWVVVILGSSLQLLVGAAGAGNASGDEGDANMRALARCALALVGALPGVSSYVSVFFVEIPSVYIRFYLLGFDAQGAISAWNLASLIFSIVMIVVTLGILCVSMCMCICRSSAISPG
jgi:hypothetical protein